MYIYVCTYIDIYVITEMLTIDVRGLFHFDHADYPTQSPTYIVYHSLQSLGMNPRFRGPKLTVYFYVLYDEHIPTVNTGPQH